MKIKDYRELLGINQREAAQQLGYAPSVLCRWEAGAIPRRAAMAKIRQWSKGAVTLADFEQQGGE
jgi:transcriptional regulator with XRE-family HTH domain